MWIHHNSSSLIKKIKYDENCHGMLVDEFWNMSAKVPEQAPDRSVQHYRPI